MSDPALVEVDLTGQPRASAETSSDDARRIDKTAFDQVGRQFHHPDLVAALVTLIGETVVLAAGFKEVSRHAVEIGSLVVMSTCVGVRFLSRVVWAAPQDGHFP
jgi:hypothetical protein